MPFKNNASRRRRIPMMRYRVTNWPEYEACLKERGSLTLWVTPEALAAWRAPRRKTRGGQPRYSDLAIETALTLGCVFGMQLRQTEGLVKSLCDLMGLAHLHVPDHTTLSRRAQTRSRLAEDKFSLSQRGAARGGRQHRPENIRRWPMAGGQAWCPPRRQSFRLHPWC
jgi:hypothetical protein